MIPVRHRWRIHALPYDTLDRYLTGLGLRPQWYMSLGRLRHNLLLNDQVRCSVRTRYYTEKAAVWPSQRSRKRHAYGGWKFWLPTRLFERMGKQERFCDFWILVPIQQDLTIRTDQCYIIPWGAVGVNLISIYPPTKIRQARRYEVYRNAWHLLREF